MNQIKVYFTPCTPDPTSGYEILYKVVGATNYISAGYFFTSPAIFYDTLNPAGTCYEGFIRSSCAGTLGMHVNWESCVSGPALDNSSCGTQISVNTADLNYTDLGLFDLHVDGSTSVDIYWQSYDRPDKFSLYEDGILIDGTGWQGYAPYFGPWGASLSTTQSGSFSFIPIPGRIYQLRIEVGNAGPPPYDSSDNFVVDIVCN